LPDGFRLVLDQSVRTFRHGTVLVGGHPGRLLTLTADGVDTLSSLLADGTTSEATGRLGRRLVDAGMAHPRPGDPNSPDGGGDLTVVVPTHNRSAALDRCLSSLGRRTPVVVVDDASDDPATVVEVCRRHGARLIRRATNGGPAAARNDALPAIDTELVAFVDSDCTVGDGWSGPLVSLFDDPTVGAVAPRVRPQHSGPGLSRPGLSRPGRSGPGRSALARFTDSHSALDMGPEPSEVGPDRTVRYVPTAALLVRLRALGAGFDPELRFGEDVDLVWRLLDAGWRVRYEPSVTVSHGEPVTWRELLARRFRYGTSAGALAERHPGRLAPVELRPWPSVAAAAALTGRRRFAAFVVVAMAADLARRVRDHGIPLALSLRWSAESVAWTVVGVGRAATMLSGPVLIVAILRGGRAAVPAALLLGTPPLVEWRRRRPGLDPVRWWVASVADDMAYGAGVWEGCLRRRSFGPLIPAVRLQHRATAPTPVAPTGADLV
jgi:mycofactocin system glycosyltransferase